MGWTLIMDFFLSLIDFCEKAIFIVMKIVMFLPRIFEIIFYVINPTKLLRDLLFSFTDGTIMVYKAVVNNLFGDMRSYFSKPQSGSNDGDPASDSVCFGETYMATLIMVLSPPLYVALSEGLKAFPQVVFCCVLTYFYYIPGLMYAILY
tara:strand:+ start:44 stop:490 length:447 start_codon:yes stop_codon:yes gene_type:complete